MPLRKSTLVGVFALALCSTGARAGLVSVTSYDMNNGNGLLQNGDNKYFDTTYTPNTVPPNANKNGSSLVVPSNAAPKEAQLSGGVGKLTDTIIPTQNYSYVPQEYVGWKYQDPNIVFHLATGSSVSTVTLYVASSYAATLGFGGLVGQPKSVDVSITAPDHTIFIPTYTTAFSDYLGDKYDGTEVITLSFSKAISSSDLFSLTLNRGPLLQDDINYHNQYPDDTINDFNNSAFTPNLEPWILLSEVQFTAAVPEPSTWMMIIAGFAGLGFVASRRKARAALAIA